MNGSPRRAPYRQRGVGRDRREALGAIAAATRFVGILPDGLYVACEKGDPRSAG
jgi:hypothetical protein